MRTWPEGHRCEHEQTWSIKLRREKEVREWRAELGGLLKTTKGEDMSYIRPSWDAHEGEKRSETLGRIALRNR